MLKSANYNHVDIKSVLLLNNALVVINDCNKTKSLIDTTASMNGYGWKMA